MSKLLRIFSALNGQRFGKQATRILSVLALVFTLTALLSPTPAAAAPTGPKDGMFDCLGEFDIGCRIIGFLFEDKGMTHLGPGSSNGNIDSNSVQSALKKTMGFFSNAVLIIASLKLLYELIQMVAETAHSGRIGGREANTLWAPIRLVVAIGLLVPLSGGLNSGQYIVIQIAKWGSGLGSQTWKVFTEALFEKQSLVPSISPTTQPLVVAALKNYVCMEAYNYYVDAIKNPSIKMIRNQLSSNREGVTYQFSVPSSNGSKACGSITHYYPISGGTDEQKIADQLTVSHGKAFEAFEGELQKVARQIVMKFVGTGQFAAMPSPSVLDPLVANLQQRVVEQTNQIGPRIATDIYNRITEKMKNAANYYGWMSAGSWFLALTRAQGAMITATMKLSLVSDANLNGIGNDAQRIVTVYDDWVNSGARKAYPIGGTADGAEKIDVEEVKAPLEDVIGAISGGATEISNALEEYRNFTGTIPDTDRDKAYKETIIKVVQKFPASFFNILKNAAEFIGKSPRDTANYILKIADDYAGASGLWQTDRAGATTTNRNRNWNKADNHIIPFNDTNPFAQLIDLGHRKIQLALDYWGVAVKFAAMGIGTELMLRFMSPSNVSALLPNFANAGGLVGTFGMMVASLFIILSAFAILAGIFLAFLIPLMPFVRFFYAIITWIASIIEAMICIPFFALAHLTPNGNGFTGPRTKYGYTMILQILVRPALTIFGLIGALLIFIVGVRFLNAMYNEATAGVAIFDGGPAFAARMIFGIFHATLIYICANMCFKMIDHIPRRALQWFGDNANEESYHDEQGTLNNMAGNVTSHIGSEIIRAPTQVGGTLRLR